MPRCRDFNSYCELDLSYWLLYMSARVCRPPAPGKFLGSASTCPHCPLSCNSLSACFLFIFVVLHSLPCSYVGVFSHHPSLMQAHHSWTPIYVITHAVHNLNVLLMHCCCLHTFVKAKVIHCNFFRHGHWSQLSQLLLCHLKYSANTYVC